MFLQIFIHMSLYWEIIKTEKTAKGFNSFVRVTSTKRLLMKIKVVFKPSYMPN